MTDKIINIKGKNYRLVQDRVKQFRSMENYEGYCLHTELLHFDGTHIILKGHVLDPNGMVISEGIAAEKVGSSNINQTSFAENCQTSAVGRALAFLDEKLMGDSLPSADEMTGALNNQAVLKMKTNAVCDLLRSCTSEEHLRDLWKSNGNKWKQEFGDFGFKVIEEHKNRIKESMKKAA